MEFIFFFFQLVSSCTSYISYDKATQLSPKEKSELYIGPVSVDYKQSYMLHFGLGLCVTHNRIIVMYFFASLSFLVVGLYLRSVTQTLGGAFQGSSGIFIASPPFVVHPYVDLGLRLFGFGIFLVVATFYQSLVGERKASQKHFLKIR